MKNTCKRIFFVCTGLVVLVIARLGVSMGRLIYSLHTGQSLTGGDEVPTWQELIFGDPFFYIGAAALIAAIVCLILLRRGKKG